MCAKSWLVLLLLAAIIAAAPALAQQSGRLAVVADVGMIKPFLEHPNAPRFETETDLAFGGHVEYGITDRVGVQMGLLWSNQQVRTSERLYNEMTIEELNTMLRWNILFGQFEPYLMAGVNYYFFNLEPPLEDTNDIGATFGLGIEATLTDHFSVGLAARYGYVFASAFDSAQIVSAVGTLAWRF